MPWAMCTCTSLLIIEKVKRTIIAEVNMSNVYLILQYIVTFQYSGSVTIYDLQIPFLASVFPLILLAGLFYLGQKFHTISMRMSDAIHQIEWYHYPHSVQRFLLIMILRSQQPFYLSAYGIMELNMENFVGVSDRRCSCGYEYIVGLIETLNLQLLKWMYSAYMLLRSID